MINDWSRIGCRPPFSLRRLKRLTLGVLACVLASGLSVRAQSPAPTNSPPPPDQTEVLRRALREIQDASNDPVAALAAPGVAPSVTSSPPAAVIPPASGTPSANGKPGPGAKFSELPPDLSPDSDLARAPDSRTNVLLPAIGALPTDSTNAMATLDDTHGLAIGDRLSFRIVEDEEDPKSLIVMDSGELEVPYLGRFPAVGKTCKHLARALKAELEKEYYHQATVIVAVDLMAKSRGKVYLVGPVRAPGPQEIPSDEVLTLSKAILRAGGFNDFADKQKVKVTRKAEAGGPDRVFTVNVAEVLEKGRTESDLPLKPGDLIYVPERLIRF